MIPFGGDTVTLFHRTETMNGSGKHIAVYTKSFLYGCSWRRTHTLNRESETMVPTESVTVRVPAGQVAPMAGDVMVRGVYSGEIVKYTDIQALIEAEKARHGAIIVKTVSDNTLGGAPIKHYRVTG